MDVEEELRRAVDQRRHDLDLLFQRLNFFLVATAFLIGAFVAAVSSDRFESSDEVRDIGYILAGAGIYLSLVFSVVEYLNSRMVTIIHRYMRQLDKMSQRDKSPEHGSETDLGESRTLIHTIHEAQKETTTRLFERFVTDTFRDIGCLIFNPSEIRTRNIVPHASMIPLFFLVLWMVLFFLGLPFRWTATVIVFGSMLAGCSLLCMVSRNRGYHEDEGP